MRQNTEMFSQGLRSAHGTRVQGAAADHLGRRPDVGRQRERRDEERSPDRHRRTRGRGVLAQDETVIVVDSAGDHLITEMFPGATEIS